MNSHLKSTGELLKTNLVGTSQAREQVRDLCDQSCDQIKKAACWKLYFELCVPERFSSEENFQQLAGETSLLLSLRRSGGRRGGSLRRDSAVVKC